jgi:hypothetical protein
MDQCLRHTPSGHATPSALWPSSSPAGARSNPRHRIPGGESAHPLAATGPESAGSGRPGRPH